MMGDRRESPRASGGWMRNGELGMWLERDRERLK